MQQDCYQGIPFFGKLVSGSLGNFSCGCKSVLHFHNAAIPANKQTNKSKLPGGRGVLKVHDKIWNPVHC